MGDCFCCDPPWYWSYPDYTCANFASRLYPCWQIEVAGISNGVCGECDNYNGTFLLTLSGSCSWESELILTPTCSVLDGSWQMIDPAQEFGAGTLTNGSATYLLSSGSIFFGDDLEFTFVGASNLCQTYPATITATPIECP